VIGLDMLGLDHGLQQSGKVFVNRIDFSDVLVQGMLSLLLFAGALPDRSATDPATRPHAVA